MQPGEALCGVETDKAVVDFEMQEEGYIAAILFPEGTKDVVLGTTIAILVDEEKDVAAFKNYKEDGAPAEAAPAKAAPAAPAKQAAPAKSYPDHVVLEMPNLSPTMEKVSKSQKLNHIRAILPSGTRKSETRCSLARLCAALRLTKLLWTSRCKKRATSLRFCIPTAARTFLSVNLLLFWHSTKAMWLLLRIGRLAAEVRSPLLQRLLPAKLLPRLLLLPAAVHPSPPPVIVFS